MTDREQIVDKSSFCSSESKETDILMIKTCSMIEIILDLHKWKSAKKKKLPMYLSVVYVSEPNTPPWFMNPYKGNYDRWLEHLALHIYIAKSWNTNAF